MPYTYIQVFVEKKYIAVAIIICTSNRIRKLPKSWQVTKDPTEKKLFKQQFFPSPWRKKTTTTNEKMWWKKRSSGRSASFSLLLPHKYFLGNFLSGKFYDFLKFLWVTHNSYTPFWQNCSEEKKMFNHHSLWIQSNKKK